MGGEGVVAYRYKLDNAQYSAETPISIAFGFINLTDGSHTVSVIGKDAAGNWLPESSPTTVTWTVDTVASDITITAKPASPSNQPSGTFSFTSTDITAAFEYKLDSGSYTACTSPYNYANLPDGSHTFTVRTKDAAGNVSPTPASYSWIVTSPVTLNVDLAGTGKGSVLITPSGIACNANYSALIDRGAQVILKATPEVYSLFSGWASACNGTGDCTVTMDADTGVTATFDKDTAHSVRIDGVSQSYYSSILGAYTSAVAGDVIKAWGTDFTENLNFNLGSAVTIKGGFDSAYTTNAGVTILHGVLTIGTGSVIIDNLVIQ